jgi:hypothetical protein
MIIEIEKVEPRIMMSLCAESYAEKLQLEEINSELKKFGKNRVIWAGDIFKKYLVIEIGELQKEKIKEK